MFNCRLRHMPTSWIMLLISSSLLDYECNYFSFTIVVFTHVRYFACFPVLILMNITLLSRPLIQLCTHVWTAGLGGICIKRLFIHVGVFRDVLKSNILENSAQLYKEDKGLGVLIATRWQCFYRNCLSPLWGGRSAFTDCAKLFSFLLRLCKRV